MAKKKGGYRVVYKKAARHYRRASGFAGGLGGGKFGPIIQGALGGIASGFLAGKVPYGGILGLGAVGYFMGNPTLLTLAGMQLGAQVTPMISGITGGGDPAGYV